MRRISIRHGVSALVLTVIVCTVLPVLAGKRLTVVEFETAKVERGSLRTAVSATGTLSALKTVDVGTQVSGTMMNATVEIVVLEKTNVLKIPLSATKFSPSSISQELLGAPARVWILKDHVPQRVSVAIARALINDPRLILADEPTGNLDSRNGVEIMELFTDLNRRGKTVVVVTHEPMIARFAKRRVILRDGAIVSEVHVSESAMEPVSCT